MSLDSQLRPDDDFYAQAYKAPVEENKKEELERGRKPSLGWTLAYISYHSSIGVAGLYQTGKLLAGEEVVPDHLLEAARYPIIGATGVSSLLLLSTSLLVGYGYLKNRKKGTR